MAASGAGLAAAAVAAAAGAVVAAGAGMRLLRRRLAVVAVVGPSMRPTLAPGDRVLARRVGPGGVRAGQIVVIEKPGDDGSWPPRPAGVTPARSRLAQPGEWMVKRVAAVPGDPRPSFMPARAQACGPVVPAGRLVVLGDNPARSLDSRQIGYVPADRVLGVVLRSMRTGRPSRSA